MTPQLLVIKIQSIVNGTSQSDIGQLKLLAAEYNKLHKLSAQRLEQCISLIKTNRDYLALELAESDTPPLLDTINIISFTELAQWKDLCADKGIEICPAFDDYYIELLQSLYTKNIGQTHPLYRDYRRAMRTHNFRNALKIIGTISRINSNDFEIKQEYLRLLNSEIKHSLTKLNKAIAKKDETEILDLYTFLDAHKDEFEQDENNWESITLDVKEIKKEQALKDKDDILSFLADADANLDWELCLAKIQELRFLQNEYSFGLTQNDETLIEEKKSIAKSKKEENDIANKKALLTTQALTALGSENKATPAKSRLSLYKEISKESQYIEIETLKKLEKRISRLSKIIFFKRLTKFTSLVCLLAICVFAYIYTKEQIKAEESSNLAAVQIEQLNLNKSIKETEKALNKYKRDFPTLLDKYADKLEKIESKIELQNTYKEQADALIAKINAVNKSELNNASQIQSINSDLSSLSEVIANMLENDANLYIIKANETKTKFKIKLNELENDFNKSIKHYLSSLENCLNSISFNLGKADIEAINNSSEILAELKSTIETDSGVFELHSMDKAKLEELSSKQLELKSKLDTFLGTKNALADSHKLDDYLNELKKLQSNQDIPSKLRSATNDILAKSAEIRYGTKVKEFTSEEIETAGNIDTLAILETLPSDILDLEEIHIYDNGPLKVYTEGALKETKTTWKEGYEIIQSGKKFSERGRTLHVMNSKIVQSNGMSKDKTYSNGQLSKEAEFVKYLQQEKHSLLALINLIANSDTDPLFKAWLENEIFEQINLNGKSGLIFSSIAQDRARLVKRNTLGLNKFSWMQHNPQKKKEIAYTLYAETLPDLQADATKRLNKARALFNTDLSLIGFVDENGEIHINLDEHKDDSIYGIDIQGKEVLLLKGGKLLTKAMPFSPLVLRQ